MPNSWRECQGLAWSDPLRERRSNNSASTSSSGTGKKTNSSPSPHLPFPLLSSPFFFYSLPLFVSSSSFLLLPFSLLPSSPLPSSLFSPSLPPLFLYLLLCHTIHTVLGFQALSQCPWMFKTFACSMRSHTESAGRRTAQGNLTEVCLSLSQNDMAAYVPQRVLV